MGVECKFSGEICKKWNESKLKGRGIVDHTEKVNGSNGRIP